MQTNMSEQNNAVQTIKSMQSSSQYSIGQTSNVVKTEKPLVLENESKKTEVLTALGAFFLGLLYIYSFIFPPMNYYYDYEILHSILKLFFTVSFFVFCEFLFQNYSKRNSKGEKIKFEKPSTEANFWRNCALLISIAIVLHAVWYEYNASFMRWNNSDGLVLVYGGLALHLISAYWVLVRTKMLYMEETSAFFPLDVFNAFAIFPFSRFFYLPCFTARTAFKSKKVAPKKLSKNIAIAIVVAVISFVFFNTAVSLLSISDDKFGEIVDVFLLQFNFNFLTVEIGEFFFRFLFSVPVSFYLFSLFTNSILEKRKIETGEKITKVAEKTRQVSANILGGILSLFILLYALYFVVQGEYFFSAFKGELPTIFTYAEYARKGFFELCQIMALNLTLLAIVAKASLTTLRKSKFLKITALALLVQSLLFAATAFSKLALYIYMYGITDLRLLSSWAVLMLTVAVVLSISSILKAKPIIKTLVYICTVSFTALCFIAG